MPRDGLLLTVLTPPGRGAIATLALRGPGVWDLVRALFQRPKASKNDTVPSPLPETPTLGKFWLGWLGDQTKGGADQVVLLVKQIEPTPWLELHCHGGPEVI